MIFAIAAIVGISIGACHKSTSNTNKLIDPNYDCLTFTNHDVTIGQDFDTDIIINESLTDHVLPDEIEEIKSGDVEILQNIYTYEIGNGCRIGKLHIPGKYVKGDIIVKMELEAPRWYLDNDYLQSLKKSDVTEYGGVIQTIKINGLDHQVRLIGVDEDYEDEEKTKPIHTTWEFVNLISGTNGYSLSTQWNDTNNTYEANRNYFDSSIRRALNSTDNTGFLWGERGADKWSNNYKKSVINMLPRTLSAVIKAPSKYISIYDESESRFKDEIINDKLFLLTPREMGDNQPDQEELTTTYSYYENSTEAKRVKKQVNNDEEFTYSSGISNDDRQIFQDVVQNFAGYNYSTDLDRGGFAWLRSPVTYSDCLNSWYIGNAGFIFYDEVFRNARGVAPAFCL